MLRYIIAPIEEIKVNDAIVSLKKLYLSLRTDKDTATGIACINTITVSSITGRLKITKIKTLFNRIKFT